MHPTILVKRKAEAVSKLVFASEALAETLNFTPDLIAGLHPIGIRDTHVREMMLLEGVADLVTAVAIQTGAMKESAPVTVETPEPVAESEGAFLSPETAEAPEQEIEAKRSPKKRSRK